MPQAAQSQQPQALTPGLRRYLYATAGLTGAAILIVEILGAKMLSPFVGASHFVWTAQITITLISLATGYYLGGWLVDYSPRLSRIYYCILGAALYLAASIFFVEPAAYACLRFQLSVGALIASAILFFVPLTLLAAVGPFMVRMLTVSFHVMGRQIGTLSAISTFGSVIGTLLIGYVLLPFLPNSVTMAITAVGLMLVCLTYFLIWGRAKIVKAGVIIIVGAVLAAVAVRHDLSRGYKNVKELVRLNSNFGLLQVIELRDGSKRFFLNDFLVQNSYDPNNGKSLALFTYMLHLLPKAYLPKIDEVLCIGLGVGIAPMDFAREGKKVDVVEINPTVVPLAKQFFGLEPERMNIAIEDGRYFVNASTKKYDVVLLDAFLGDASPSHLMSKEAFEQMSRVMNSNSVLVINSFGDFSPGMDFFVTSLHKTLKAVFKSVVIHGTGSGNVFFVASQMPELKFTKPPMADVHPALRSDVERCLDGIIPIDQTKGLVLTDDFNPTEFYDHKTREKHRRNLAENFRYM